MPQQIPTQGVPVQAPPDDAGYSAHRPGLVTFAGVMMAILAVFAIVAALTEWSNSVWLYEEDFSVAGSKLVFWGFVDFGIAMLSAYAAYLLFTAHRSGQIMGLLFTGISFVRWLFYIPADPWLAISILVVDGLIIYGLSANDEWFGHAR